MGGRNIGIHIGVQSAAQLVHRFGQAAAESILTNAASIMLFGGTRSRDDLATYAMLVGDREQTHHTWDHSGRLHSTSTRTVPVLSPAQISQLPARQVVIIRRGLAPMIGRVQMAWKRAEVRDAQRAARWERRLAVLRRRMAPMRAWGLQQRAELAQQIRLDLAELRELAAALAGWLRHRSARWTDRVPGETPDQRRVRRAIEAVQRRARKRGL
jgi:type IV secretory pathway TraG/TraD family ATPase VirD4